MAAHATSLVGAILSRRFRLTRLIGEGGLGVVYAAESIAPLSSGSGKYPVDVRQLAIKLLRPEFVGEPDGQLLLTTQGSPLASYGSASVWSLM